VGQLARSGKVLSRQIGKRWYVERSGILAHKEQKDALLAAVQAQSVGLARTEHAAPAGDARTSEQEEPVFRYSTESHADLLPHIAPAQMRAPELFDDEDDVAEEQPAHYVPIRVNKRHDSVTGRAFMRPSHTHRAKRERTSNVAIITTAAFTVVVVLSFGLSLLKTGTKFADAVVPAQANPGAFLGAAAAAIERYGAVMEDFLIPELVYVRKE
jgi:hypothetical protein